MKKPKDYADLLLNKAKQDALLFDKLIDDHEISDEILGFHIEQAIEKSLKCILVFHNIPFRKTHDIRELLDLIHDNNIQLPDTFNTIDEWTPYAVQYRYDDINTDTIKFNRKNAQIIIWDLIKWIESYIK